ncbi:MAG TPA: cobalamin-binding protein [Thermodesulfovibrionales bacterium]|nr:cobalamin-binding protein [Thermodesulfovibrionales bacterium]
MKHYIVLFFLFFTLHSFLCTNVQAESPGRIISLAPSMTEILFALGLGDNIVGVASFSDYPAEAKKKPMVGGMKNPSIEAVVSLKPDIVIMTIDGNRKEFEERLHSLKIRTYVFRAKRISELPQGIRDLGAALGQKERAEALAEHIGAGIRTTSVQGGATKKKKVLFIVWPEPLIVAGPGSIADDVITILGGQNIADETKITYPKFSIEEIVRRSPDIIFIGKGSGMEKVSQGLLERLNKVPAVRNKKVYYVGDYLYRLGPRTVTGVEELARYMEER